MTRAYARAPVGVRAVAHVPRNRGTVTTMIAAMGLDGVRTLVTHEGATDADTFRAFVVSHLLPTLRAGDVVVMDNLAAHHAAGIRDALELADAEVLYLPAYSPDFSPIESMWSKLKERLRALGARTVTRLRAAIAAAMTTIGSADAAAWFRDCGYP